MNGKIDMIETRRAVFADPSLELIWRPNRQQWNDFVTHSPFGHVMQSWEWGEFKQAAGWQVERIGLVRKSCWVGGMQILFKHLPLVPLTIAYIPKGPIIDLTDESAALAIRQAIYQIARRQRAIFLKIEPNMPDDERVHVWLCESGFRPSAQTNQPRCTIILDLVSGEEALLASMRKKTRQLIRRAEREGVQVVQGSEADLDDFYRIMTTTAEIKDIEVHRSDFYHHVWQTFQANGAVHLFLARHQEQTVAAKMVLVFRDTSLHLWGGTSPQGRDVYASYLIQWEAIRWAASQGLAHCDLWGIPDEIADLVRVGQEIPSDQQDGLWGVYTFKRGFGGRIESYVGAYDDVYHPLLYWMGMKMLGHSRTVDTASSWLERISRAR